MKHGYSKPEKRKVLFLNSQFPIQNHLPSQLPVNIAMGLLFGIIMVSVF